MAAGVCLLIIGMPVSTAMQEIGAITACAALAVGLLVDPSSSLVRRFPLRCLFAAFLGYLLLNCLLSIDIGSSFSVLRSALHRGFLLFLVGMELARRERCTTAVIWALALMGFYEGLDGIWQYVSGRDFLADLPLMGNRLTGSFSTYRVGNLMALALAGSLALPLCLPRPWPFLPRLALALLIWGPALFLCIFAQARSGYICLAGALAAFFALYRGLSRRWVLSLVGLLVCGLIWGPDRISLDAVLRDGRIKELWPFAWSIFTEYPLFGSGLGTFSPAFNSLGLIPAMHSANIQHPHNIYLQLLAETGLCGFLLFCSFVGLILWRSLRIIRAVMAQPSDQWPALPLAKAATFWSAAFGYVLMGISAHSLFRSWWLSLGFLFLGLTAGMAMLLDRRAELGER
jgi:O-antigen ligase